MLETVAASIGSGTDPSSLNKTRLQVVSDFAFPFLPTADGSGQTVHPSVKYFPEKWNGYAYWMAVSGYKGGSTVYENTHIFVSNDLTSWGPPPGFTNPLDVAVLGDYQSDPYLFFKDNTLFVYYRDGTTLLRRSTTDGSNWTARELCTSAEIIVSPSIHYLSGVWYMWACLQEGGSLFKYESSDGVNWGSGRYCRYNARHTLDLWHCDVWRDGGLFHIVASAGIGGMNTLQTTQLFYGSSIDGENWYIDKLACVPKGAASELAWRVYKSCVVRHGNKQLLFVSGGDRPGGTQLTGFAWAELSVQPKPDFPLIDENWVMDYSNLGAGASKSYGWFKPSPYNRLRGIIKLEYGGELTIRQGGSPSNAYSVFTRLVVPPAIETVVDMTLDLPWVNISVANTGASSGYLRNFLHLLQ